MIKIVTFLRSKTVATFLIVLGVCLILIFGFRAMRAFRRMPPFPPHPPPPLESVEAIRPWMNLKYVSKVYKVPSDYLARYLQIPHELQQEHISLDDLNLALNLGTNEAGEPLIVEQIEFAIIEFHAHPNFHKTRMVEPTMSIRFIVTETGIPETYFADRLNLSLSGDEFSTIELLSMEQNYPGGSQALTEAIQQIVNTYED
ncbi:MAG: hypothetical protein Fur0022_30840 [Anaerolineales bacterium]